MLELLSMPNEPIIGVFSPYCHSVRDDYSGKLTMAKAMLLPAEFLLSSQTS